MKDRLKKLRKELNLTQQAFADKIGIKRNTIANYEVGRNEPIDAVISLICREFDVNEEWLRTGKGEMFIKVLPEDELAAYCAQICAGVDPFIESAILEYMRLDENSKGVIRKMVCSISERMKKKETGE